MHFSKGKLQNSHSLMQAVKNNNQECSIREMHSPRLWVLQVDCTVITSPEDPGEESFQKRGGELARQENFMLCRHLHALLLLETKHECLYPISNKAGNTKKHLC